jgi:hypothetical protein
MGRAIMPFPPNRRNPMRFIARITILVESPSVSDTSEAHAAIADIMSAQPGVEAWDYVSIDGDKTGPMLIEAPSVDELFDTALADA